MGKLTGHIHVGADELRVEVNRNARSARKRFATIVQCGALGLHISLSLYNASAVRCTQRDWGKSSSTTLSCDGLTIFLPYRGAEQAAWLRELSGRLLKAADAVAREPPQPWRLSARRPIQC